MDEHVKKSYGADMGVRGGSRPVMSIPLALSSVVTLALLVIATPSSPRHHLALDPTVTSTLVVHDSPTPTPTSHEVARQSPPAGPAVPRQPTSVSPTTTNVNVDVPTPTAPRVALSRGVVGSPGAPLSFLTVSPRSAIELVVTAPADIAVFDGTCRIEKGAQILITNTDSGVCTVAITTQSLSQWQTFATA